MALTVQNLRAVGTGVEPASLLPGQIAFNITDKVLYVGDGSSFKTDFQGAQVPGTPGEGWYSMPMDFASLGDYYVANPGIYGDVPTDQQVLTWSTALNHPIWTSGGGGGGGNQVYVVTNAQVASAPGATTSAKISAAIGVASPDEGDVAIVTGLPDDVYEGLYFFLTEWVRGAAYAYPSATEVIYNNTVHPTLGPTVQAAIDDLDDGLIATTAIANTANSTATSALAIANAAIPRASFTGPGQLLVGSGAGVFVALSPGAASYILQSNGDGTLSWVPNSAGDVTSVTGVSPIVVDNTNPQTPIVSIDAATTASSGAVQLNDTVTSTSVTQAATANAAKTAYDAGIQGQIDAAAAQATADAALPKAGGTMTGNITFQDAGEGIVFNGGSQVFAISDSTSTTSNTTAASSTAVKSAYDLANAAVPRSSYAADGDILVGTGSGTFGPLAVGTNGQILGIIAGTPAWIDDAPGDVTSVSATAPITVDNTDPENPIIGVDLATTATPGVVQIELTGNLTLVGGVINVPDASTTVKGAVQLNNTLSSSSTTQALTAAKGQDLQGQINALTFANNTILAGGYDAATGLVDGATAAGIAQGFTDGNPPPAPAAGNADYYLVCIVSGNNPSPMENGDWLYSDGTQYIVLGVGARPASASYVQAGIVQLADSAAVLAGTSDTLAITPQALQDNVIDSVTTVNSSQIASATAVKTAYDAGITGQTAAAAAQATANAALPKAGGTMTGTLTAQNINVLGSHCIQFSGGINGSVDAISDSTSTTSSTTAASATAVKAAYDAAAAALPLAGGIMTGDIEFQSGSAYGILFYDGSFLDNISDSVSTTDSTMAASATAVKTAYDAGVQGQTDAAAALAAANAAQVTANAAVPCASFTALGNLLAGTGAGTYSALGVGSNQQVLIADNTCATGIKWGNACYVPDACFTAKGQLIVGTGAGAYVALNPGSNGQLLVPNSACTNGVEWVTCQGISICGYSCTATPFNTAIGAQAGDSVTSATGLTAIGYQAGTAVTTGGSNTFVGWVAGSSVTTGSQNVAVGVSSGGLVTTGIQNTHVGWEAGDQTNASYTVAIGSRALGGNHTQNGTVAVGVNALAAATSGANNTAVGFNAGCAITAGSNNTILGTCALDATTLSTDNTAIGYNALTAVTTGGNNTAVGSLAADLLTTGSNNIAIGLNALGSTTSGASNIAIGVSAMENGAAGNSNVAVGSNAGRAVTSSCNVFIGSSAGTAVTSGTLNTFVGFTAGDAVTTGSNNTIIGDIAGSAALSDNLILAAGSTIKFQANGSGAWSYDGTNFGTTGQFLASQGSSATPVWCTLSLACVPCSAYTAKGDIVVGTGAATFSALPVGTNGQVLVPNSSCTTGLEWITTGALCIQGYTCAATPFNTAVGGLAGDSITSGTNNTVLGYNAGTGVTTGSFNVLLGSGAGSGVSIHDSHVGIGYQTLVGALDINNSGLVAIGTCALRAVTTGINNLAIGFCAGATITNGGCNIAIGARALDSVTTTANNIGIGFSALTNITSGSENMGIGTLAGQAVTTGTNNHSIGYLAGCAVSTGTDNTFLGDQAGRNTTGSFNVFLGGIAGCGVTSGTCSVGIGYDALNSTFTGTQVVAIGRSAGTALTSGSCSTLVGHNAGAGSTTSCNTAVGWCALATNTTGCFNTVVGVGAGQQGATPASLVAIGHTAGQSVNNTGTVAIGRAALQNATTGVNTAIGYFALQQHIAAANSTAVGYQAGCAATGGGHTLIGNNSGCAITTGTNNTIVGPYIGTTTLTNNVVLADGSANIRFQANSSGAWSYNGVNFGNAGDTLQSGGTGAPPTWVTGASGTFTSQDGKTITVTNGLITSIV